MNPIITQFLPKEVRALANKFTIPEKFIKEMPDLISLIIQSKSIDKDTDKQGWFNLLPMMSSEQITRLKDILTREKQKLEEIELKYEQKKIEIKKKYLMKRQSMGYIKKINDMKEKEQNIKQQEHQEADELLENI